MLISVFSPKGGTGTTIASSLIAKCLSEYSHTLLVETENGDLQAVMGADRDPTYGFTDWVNSPQPSYQSLQKIAVNVLPNLDFVVGKVWESNSDENSASEEIQVEKLFEIDSGHQIPDALCQVEGHCVVDLSLASSKSAFGIANSSDLVVVVLRKCFLGLWRAMNHQLKDKIDVCIVVGESGRSITSVQIAETLRVGTLIELDARRDFARAIDAGVLMHRTPERMIEPIWAYIHDVIEELSDNSYESALGDEVCHDIFSEYEESNAKAFWGEPCKKDLISLHGKRDGVGTSGVYSKYARSLLKDF